MPQSYSKLYYHIVFNTLNREPTLSPDMRPRLFEYISGIVRNKDGTLIKAGGVADHVHLLALLSRETALSDIVRDIKTNSSRWVHETFPHSTGFAWQRGFGAFTIGRSEIERVEAYIEGQEEHHRARTFMEEFEGFLAEYEIEYKPEYLWE